MPGNDPMVDADAAMVRGEAPPSARLPLDRDRIVAAAIEFIDDEGLAGLTMRRLGERLGVEAMSMYRYVPGKEDLLDAVVESLVMSMAADGDVLDEPRDGWQDFLQRLAHGVRRVALAHPKIFPLVASRPPEAPWLRPPLRSIDWVESFLTGLISEGFTDDAAVAGYRAFSSSCCSRWRPTGRTSAPSTRSTTARRTTPISARPRRWRGCAGRCRRTTRRSSSRKRSRTCSTGWRCCAARAELVGAGTLTLYVAALRCKFVGQRIGARRTPIRSDDPR
jgi:AcrR family transcriptional regulator